MVVVYENDDGYVLTHICSKYVKDLTYTEAVTEIRAGSWHTSPWNLEVGLIMQIRLL